MPQKEQTAMIWASSAETKERLVANVKKQNIIFDFEELAKDYDGVYVDYYKNSHIETIKSYSSYSELVNKNSFAVIYVGKDVDTKVDTLKNLKKEFTNLVNSYLDLSNHS